MKKHLYYYTQHSQYNEPTDKPAVSYCKLEDEVHYHPDPFNGHEYVDLGLPSGTLWATMNVGANSETGYGFYFAWGESQGYANASTKEFSWDDYEFNPSGDSSTFTKYNSIDSKTVLELEDDAAHANWSGEWHMPTKLQCDELFNTSYVTNAWVTNYLSSGVSGLLFTSVSNSNTLFIPAAGSCGDGAVSDVGELGGVWSSSLNANSVDGAWFFSIANGGGVVSESYRCNGFSVRGVVTPTRNLITFTIGSTSYQAEEGMKWRQWVNSEYNTNGYYIIYNSGVWNSSRTGAIENVTPQDVIVANTSYNFSYTGGVGD